MIVRSREGFTLIELLVGLGLIAIIFTGIALSYSTIVDTILNAELRNAAASVLNRQIEIVRNIPFEDVGVVGAFPAGIVPYIQTVTFGKAEFQIKTTIRNIDDPFDGVIGGIPNDTSPADYKLLEFEASCPRCRHFTPLSLTTYVAPKNLENSEGAGSLFIYTLDASGAPLSGQEIHVINASTSPTIDIIDVTNVSGLLSLVGLPTSTRSYGISIANPGYTHEQTYTPGDPTNPNPSKPHSTVASGLLTSITFLIDKVSTVNVNTTDVLCSATPSTPFSFSGSKLIGTSPDVLKFSTTSITDSNGLAIIGDIEWDNYSFLFNPPSKYIRGSMPLSPFNINPNTTHNIQLISASAQPNGLLVTITDSLGNEVPNASVLLTKSGFSETHITHEELVTDTNWSGGSYAGKSLNIDVDTVPGAVRLLSDGGGHYTTTTVEWLISNTFNVGSPSTTFTTLSWNPISQLAETGVDSVLFQVASNNDNMTWNFVGPDGTSNSYYQSSSTLSSVHANTQYVRYKMYLKTADETITPQVTDASIGFSSACVPPSQVLFVGLSTGTYDIEVTASGYLFGTSTVVVGAGFTSTTVILATP